MRKDALVLFGWNGTPHLWCPEQLTGNVAYEVEFSYVPARWPTPPKQGLPSAADHYMENGANENAFTMLMTFADFIPPPAEMLLDGREVFRSGVLHANGQVVPIDVDVTGANELTLIVPDDGDTQYDHADWADAKLLRGTLAAATPAPAAPGSEASRDIESLRARGVHVAL